MTCLAYAHECCRSHFGHNCQHMAASGKFSMHLQPGTLCLQRAVFYAILLAILPQVHSSLLDHGVRRRLVGLWRDAQPSQADAGSDFVDTQQSAFLALCRSYKDILYPGYRYHTR